MSESISTNPIQITRRSLIRHSLRSYRRTNLGIVCIAAAFGLAWLLIPMGDDPRFFFGIVAIYFFVLVPAIWLKVLLQYSKGSIPFEGKYLTYAFTPDSACQRIDDDNFEAKFKLETFTAFAVTESVIYLYFTRKQCNAIEFTDFASEQDRQMVIQWLQAKGIKRKKV